MKISKDKPVILPDGKRLDPSKKLGIFDAAGQQIPYVHSFDTDTFEIEMMVKIKDEEGEGEEKLAHLIRDADMKPLVAKFICPGAFVMLADGTVLK